MISWQKIGEQWPYLTDLSEGMFAHAVIAGELSRLFIVSVLPNETTWRTSMLLEGVYSEQSAFFTREDAQHYAEQALIESLTSIEAGDIAFTVAVFNDPFHEIAALLTITVLEDGMNISHISEYKREWVAVCISHEHVEDYAFQRDSDGAMGMRLRRERMEVRVL